MYGHVWVVLGLLAAHPAWGRIARPRLARRYVRAKECGARDARPRPPFRTQLAGAVDRRRWAVTGLGFRGQRGGRVVDGAYAQAPFLKPVIRLGGTVVRRLRKDAALWSVPGPRRPGQRGRPQGRHFPNSLATFARLRHHEGV